VVSREEVNKEEDKAVDNKKEASKAGESKQESKHRDNIVFYQKPSIMPQSVVYFLGAGCSYNFGYPVTGSIMPEILELLTKGNLFKIGDRKTLREKKLEKELLRLLYLLYPGLKQKFIPKVIPNITEVLSFVDHCCLYGLPPHPEVSDETLEKLRHLLNRAVSELLLTYEETPYTREEKRLLAKFIDPLKRHKRTEVMTIITTNYDQVIEREFSAHMIRQQVDFGIPYRDIHTSKLIQQPANPLFRFYKLHGSLNWTRCDLCGHYCINPYAAIADLAFLERADDINTCICSDTLRLKSVMVAPSLVRDIRDANLLQIWKGATEAIRTADKLVFIGYSLPAEDLAIKSIIMRGMNGRDKKSKLKVIVVQKGEQAKPNYMNIFGKHIHYYKDGLAEYLDTR
jgi:hypothetical protein